MNAFVTQRTIVLRMTAKAHHKILCDARYNKERDRSYIVEFLTFFGVVIALATLVLPGVRGEMTDFGVLAGPAARGSGDSFLQNNKIRTEQNKNDTDDKPILDTKNR